MDAMRDKVHCLFACSNRSNDTLISSRVMGSLKLYKNDVDGEIMIRLNHTRPPLRLPGHATRIWKHL
jgi:hypothetical protein